MVRKIGIYRDPRNKNRPWVVRWDGEYDSTIEKQRCYSKSFQLKADAEEFIREQATRFRKDEPRDGLVEITLKGFCVDWLKTKSSQLRPGSVILYKNTIRRLLGHFGFHLPILKINTIGAAKFIGELKSFENKQGLSNATRHKVLRNCRTMFSDAVIWQLISQNPFKTVKPPKCTIKRWHYLKADEYARLVKAAPSLRWKALCTLAYTAGLRLGEPVNLTWADLALKKGEVTVQNRTATATLPAFYVKDNERRRISLPAQTVQILKDLQGKNSAVFKVPYVLLTERQYKGVVAKWKRYQQQRWPWTNRNVTNNVLTNFKRHVKKAKIERDGQLVIHTLRKSCIQTWTDHLPPNITKELAGHPSLETTLKYYGQVGEYHMTKAARIMEN